MQVLKMYLGNIRMKKKVEKLIKMRNRVSQNIKDLKILLIRLEINLLDRLKI